MIIEAIISLIILNNFKSYLSILIFLILTLIYLSTFLIQVPIHNIISKDNNMFLLDKLIQSNWIRTLLWFFKCIASFLILNKEVL